MLAVRSSRGRRHRPPGHPGRGGAGTMARRGRAGARAGLRRLGCGSTANRLPLRYTHDRRLELAGRQDDMGEPPELRRPGSRSRWPAGSARPPRLWLAYSSSRRAATAGRKLAAGAYPFPRTGRASAPWLAGNRGSYPNPFPGLLRVPGGRPGIQLRARVRGAAALTAPEWRSGVVRDPRADRSSLPGRSRFVSGRRRRGW